MVYTLYFTQYQLQTAAIQMQDKQQTIKQVVGLGKIKDIVAGSCHSIAIRDDGIWTWGKSEFCNLGIKTSETVIYQPVFLQISVTRACAGNEHTFAWKNNEVYCWGSNKDYKLGLPDPKQYALTKSQIFVQAIDAGMQLSNISCGDSHSLAVFKLEQQQQISFQIFAWGQSRSYQLGLEAQGAVDEPILVEFNQPIQDILSRSDYNLILTQTGDCYSWGTNLFGRLGFANQIKNQKLPTKIKSLVNIKSLSMGKYHCIAISQNRQCFSWGHGLYGQLGLNQIVSQTTPTKVLLGQKIIQSACGQYHSILVTENGQMMSCGTNSYMALGHHLIDNKKRCKKFEKIETHDKKIVKVVCGYRHNLMLTSDGNVYSWGCNKYGQLGITSPKQAKKEAQIQFQRSALIKDQKKEEQLQQPVGKNNKQLKSCMEKGQKQKLESWRIRYQKFRIEKEEQQKQFMKQLNQIIGSNLYT